MIMSKIKEYLGCLIPIVLAIGLCLFLFLSNSGDKKNGRDSEAKQEQKQTHPIYDYVYIDTNETLHINLNCRAIGKEPGDLGGAIRAVSRVPIENVTSDMLDYSCSKCVTDEIYEMLLLQ